MTNYFLEYIWLDGGYPQKLRSKTKIVQSKKVPTLEKCPKWNYDGSSTGQAETSKSEMILHPVNVFNNPFRDNSILVMCEVFDVNGVPHASNKRSKLRKLQEWDQDTMYGFEQEYIIYDRFTDRILGWPTGYPRPQGDYYCGVGGSNVSGRKFVEEHSDMCLEAGLSITGINAEVMLGQWEYQIGPVPSLDGSDQLWISRWILERLSEKFNYRIEFHPKPIQSNDWNGSGMHVNFSTKEMRENLSSKMELAEEACLKLSRRVDQHISVYGMFNDLRLTGHNETCSIKEFRYGLGDRTASIRIPHSINDSVTPGYIEDRRPSSNADPYEVCGAMIATVCVGVPELANLN